MLCLLKKWRPPKTDAPPISQFFDGCHWGAPIKGSCHSEPKPGQRAPAVGSYGAAAKRFGSMTDVSMEREDEAAGGRVVAAHLVCLCCGGGWRKPIGLWRIFLGRIFGRNSLQTDRQTPDRRQFNHFFYDIIFLQNTFNVSIVRIKVARSTIGYSEVLNSRLSWKCRFFRCRPQLVLTTWCRVFPTRRPDTADVSATSCDVGFFSSVSYVVSLPNCRHAVVVCSLITINHSRYLTEKISRTPEHIISVNTTAHHV